MTRAGRAWGPSNHKNHITYNKFNTFFAETQKCAARRMRDLYAPIQITIPQSQKIIHISNNNTKGPTTNPNTKAYNKYARNSRFNHVLTRQRHRAHERSHARHATKHDILVGLTSKHGCSNSDPVNQERTLLLMIGCVHPHGKFIIRQIIQNLIQIHRSHVIWLRAWPAAQI